MIDAFEKVIAAKNGIKLGPKSKGRLGMINGWEECFFVERELDFSTHLNKK